MKFSNFLESTEKQNDGVPIYVEDATFYVRRYGTKKSNQLLKDLSKILFGPFHKKDESDPDLLFAHWLVEYGVVGWDGVFDESGNSISYDQSISRSTFLNPEMFLSLNKILFVEVNNFENYLYDSLEEDIEEIKKL